MNLSDIKFIVFFALIYFLILIAGFIRKKSTKIGVNIYKSLLFAASYVFAITWGIESVIYLLALTVFVFIITLLTDKYGIPVIPILGVVVCVSGLAVFKYLNFVVGSFSLLFSGEYTFINIIAPLGISFYTFSAISYIVDVKNKEYSANNNFMDVAIYLAYFPKLISGPLMSANDFFEKLNSSRGITFKNTESGIQLFVIGLFKKLVLADHLSVFVNDVFNAPSAFSSLSVVLAVLAFSFQLYFDFSGYSDMAIGLSEMIGIKIDKNFNLPYSSCNLTEFWKRWHISLSAWLQKNIYIPLGGNRKGEIRTYINLFLVMLIGGLWHGANWTFIIWGALHGFGLIVHKLFRKVRKNKTKSTNVYIQTLSKIGTFIFVTICWVFFRADSVGDAFLIFKIMFSFKTGITQIYIWLIFALVVYFLFLAYFKYRSYKLKTKRLNEDFYVLDLSTIKGLTVFFIVVGLTICMAYFGDVAFIYGKF